MHLKKYYWQEAYRMARSRLALFQNGCSGLERPSAIKWRQTVAGVAVVAELIFRRPDDPSDLSNFYGNQALMH